jgi:putative DNA primase/helicase
VMTRPRDFNDVLAKLPDARKGGKDKDEWTATCPCADHKTPAKHLSLKDAGDKALVHCHPDGKHSEADIKKALGFDTLKYGRQVTDQRRIEATYKYIDANGKPFEVVRFKPKDFRQRQPDGKGGWFWNLDGVPRVLYRLPELLAEFGDIDEPVLALVLHYLEESGLC